MTRTVYTIRDERGRVAQTTDADRAERLSRAGLTVTARTEETLSRADRIRGE